MKAILEMKKRAVLGHHSLFRGAIATAAALTLGATLATSCGSNDGVDDDAEAKAAVTSMQTSVSAELDNLIAAAQELHDAAPVTAGRGWDATDDQDAIGKMKIAWQKARTSYEHVEGALAPIFPDIDASIDARYNDQLADLGPDSDLFDDQGVTGLHAAERILYSDEIPSNVVELESTLPGYAPAAFPSTEAEAQAFKDKLLTKIISDAKTMKEQWTPANIDLAGAYTGLIDLMNEQREKVNRAGDQEEESRYSQRTMADLRANLEGTRSIYKSFQPWIQKSTQGDVVGATTDKEIEAGFEKLASVYDGIDGDAFPEAPATWSSESPSAEDLATPFGKLFTAVSQAVDPDTDGSVVFEMNEAGEVIGLDGRGN